MLIVNLPSINPGVTLRGMPGYPAIGGDYARTFRDLKARSVEVWFASHAVQFRMHEKYRQGDAHDPGRFVDPKGYLAAVEKLEKLLKSYDPDLVQLHANIEKHARKEACCTWLWR